MARWHLRPDGTSNEDHFGLDRAQHYMPDFRWPRWSKACGFVFEVAPRMCFDLTRGRLPFGCHARPGMIVLLGAVFCFLLVLNRRRSRSASNNETSHLEPILQVVVDN